MADSIGLSLGVAPASLTLGEALMLVGWWKGIVMLLPLLVWGVIITRVYDKHAARFHLNRQRWNVMHVTAGAVAFLLGFMMPLEGILGFLVGFVAILVVLGIDLAVYPMIANKDERVPDTHHVKIDFSSFTEAKQKKKTAKQLGSSELLVRGPDKQAVAPPADGESPEFALRLAAEQVVIKAMQARAAKFELAPTGKDNAFRVVHTIDTIPNPAETIPGPEAIKIIDFWKGAAKLDVQDRRKRQVGDVSIEKGADKKRIRFTTLGTQGGIRLSGLFDPDTSVRRKRADLGLLEAQIPEYERIVGDQAGVVILAAPPGQGRTTLTYTVVREHDAYTSNVQTLEMEILDALEGVRQNLFDPTKEGAEFSTTLRSILRRDPSVVAVAEVPDQATALEVAKSETDRTRVYATVRADGALQAIMGYVKAVGDPELAAKGLHGVIACKLLRRLCINCRVAYPPTPDVLKRLGLPADRVTQLYKKGGQVLIKDKPEVCPVCSGGGYIGLEGVLEVYSFDDAIRDRIKAGDWNGVRAELRKRQLPAMQQAAIRKAVDGLTSIEEVMRVTADQKPAAPSASKAPPAPAKG